MIEYAKTKWNNCIAVHHNGKFLHSRVLNGKEKKSVEALLAKYGPATIWFDLIERVAFSSSQNSLQGALARDRSFLCQPSKFRTKKGKFCPDCGGKEFCDSTLGKIFGLKTKGNSEYLIQDHPFFETVKDKTVMIVGGGPSAVQVPWERYRFDQLWSCNHFFMNRQMKSRKVDFFIPSNEVDLVTNSKLIGYLKKFPDSLCCLYPTVKMSTEYLLRSKERVPNITYSHLRYRSKIGIMPRLILLAYFCGAKNIMFAGMDGVPTKQLKHAFQGKKVPKGTAALKSAPGIFRRSYVTFWDYMLNELDTSNVGLFNLGENTSSNLTADISRQHFPLKRLLSREYAMQLVNRY